MILTMFNKKNLDSYMLHDLYDEYYRNEQAIEKAVGLLTSSVDLSSSIYSHSNYSLN